VSNLSFSASSFYFRKINSHNNESVHNLNEQPLSSSSILSVADLFKNFFSAYGKLLDVQDVKKTFVCEYNDSNNGVADDFDYFYAVIKSGSYGIESEITDPETGKVGLQMLMLNRFTYTLHCQRILRLKRG